MNEHEKMIEAIKQYIAPVLRERGFRGEYPSFRKMTEDKRIDFIQFRMFEAGCGFNVSFSYVLLETTSFSNYAQGFVEEEDLDEKEFCGFLSEYNIRGKYGAFFFYGDVYAKDGLFSRNYEWADSNDIIESLLNEGYIKVQSASDEVYEEVCRDVIDNLDQGFQWLVRQPSLFVKFKEKVSDFFYEMYEKLLISRKQLNREQVERMINPGPSFIELLLFPTREYANPTLYPILRDIIEDTSHVNRGRAYGMFGDVLKNSYDKGEAKYLYDRIAFEMEYNCLYVIVNSISKVKMPQEIEPVSIIKLTRDPDIEQYAIGALGSFDNDMSRKHLRDRINTLDNDADVGLLISIINALERIGSEEDIPLIEKFSSNSEVAVRSYVRTAIKNIRNRLAKKDSDQSKVYS